jgi:long-chain fatty acid transport protein
MNNKIRVISLLMGASILAAPQAIATDGYFQYGLGARHAALGGAGVANITDASGMILNPSGIATFSGSELDLALTIFSPRRKYTGSGEPSFTPLGEVVSGKNYFPIPNIAYTRSIDETSSWGIAMYGNGGMNTSWPAVERPMMECGGGAGIYCGGESGVDLMQAFISVTYAKKMGMISFGISPLLVIQRFEAKGLVAFSGFSSDPANLSDNGHELSTGVGVKLGVTADLSETIHIGGTFQPTISMSNFDKYAGLFANQGNMDIPQTFTVGASMEVSDDFTLMVDYNRIYYSKVGSVGNSTTTMLPFGATDGPGFGWSDIGTFKIGAEWKQSENLTLRAGFSRNQNPVGPEDVTLNILAPGVVRSHFTGGFQYDLSNGSAFEFAAAYVPTVSVEGAEMFNPNHTVKVEMKQYVVSFGWKKKF